LLHRRSRSSGRRRRRRPGRLRPIAIVASSCAPPTVVDGYELVAPFFHCSRELDD